MSKKKNIRIVEKDVKKITQDTQIEITPLESKHLLWMLVLVIALNLFFFPANKMSVSRKTYISGDPFSRDSIVDKINEKKPKIILVGNSMLGRGIHSQYFNDLTKIPALILAPGGHYSAWWYLVFKNIICKSAVHIPTVAIFFRDNELTDPSLSVTGEFIPRIDELCEKNEPVLDRLAYFNNMSDLELMVSSYWPLYPKRTALKNKLDSLIKENTVSELLHKPIKDMEDAKQRMFADTNMNQPLFTRYQFEMNKISGNAEFNFTDKVKTSFLPEIISLAKQNNTKLIFVRVKKRRDLTPNSQPTELITYINDLSAYFKKHNIVFIDYTNDRRIKEENYSDGDHQDNRNAPMTFTELLADTLPQFYSPVN